MLQSLDLQIFNNVQSYNFHKFGQFFSCQEYTFLTKLRIKQTKPTIDKQCQGNTALRCISDMKFLVEWLADQVVVESEPTQQGKPRYV